MSNMTEYNGIYAFHPGYFVKQIIDDAGVTQDDFANRLGVTGKSLSELVNGKINLSKDMALALSCMLGNSVDMWLGLQKNYEQRIMEIESKKRVDVQKPLLKIIDYGYFVKHAHLQEFRKAEDKVRGLCACMRIASLCLLGDDSRMAGYPIKAENMEPKNAICSRAWLLFALSQGNEARIKGKVDTDRLTQFVPEIRDLTIQGVNESIPRLKAIFQECGVTFVCLPALKDAAVMGVVKWAADRKSVTLAINDRTKTEDSFWIVLLHQIWHVLQRSYNQTYIALDSDDSQMNDQEKEADTFAKNILILPKDYDRLLANGDFSLSTIRKAGTSLHIHLGIIAARMASEKLISPQVANQMRKPFRLRSVPHE